MSETSKKPTSIRLPDDLRDYLQKQADHNTRSLAQEILHRLILSKRVENHRKIPDHVQRTYD